MLGILSLFPPSTVLRDGPPPPTTSRADQLPNNDFKNNISFPLVEELFTSSTLHHYGHAKEPRDNEVQ